MLIFTIIFFLLSALSPPTLSINQDGLYLLRFKQSLDDPTRFFSNWNDSDHTPCNWTGVVCDPTSGSVTSLDFSNSNLAGPFPLILCRLHSLSFLSFADNFINSSLPSDISSCQNLQHLDLSNNLLVGGLPETLPDIPTLKYLDLSGNNFTGEVPASYGRFHMLEVISLVSNLLDGEFPMVLCNVTTLKTLNVSWNPYKPSRLGPELGNLTRLEYFWATSSNLIGELPDSFGRLKNLINFDVSQNSLSGRVPSSLTELTSAYQIELYQNNFTGELPSGWGKMTSLRLFDAAMNKLSGTIPDELTQLPLASLNLYRNNLEGKIPESIANSPNLYELAVFENQLSGELPRKLGENSKLNLLDVSTNNLTGSLPPNLCQNGDLSELMVIQNALSGEIPTSLANCRTLTRVRLSNNRFTGNVPLSFWGLPHVYLMELSFNSFTGEISKSIASGTNISQLFISNNNFTGQLPEEVGLLAKLSSFEANDNQFWGSLPNSLVKLKQLGRLHLQDNHISGVIPSEINSLKQLNDLNLANNELTGEIPAEIGLLSTLNYLDLSNNKLSGSVPEELQDLKLNEFNLSNNHLSGELPPLFAKEMYRTSFLGNPGLCGDISGLCDSRVEVRRMRYLWVLRTIFVVAAVVFLVGVVWFYFKYKSFKEVKSSIDKSKWTLMSFHKLGFSEYEILDCLDEDNVIGSGASGKVYKAVLSNGEAVAVKKLWGNSNKDVEGGDGDIENGGMVQDNGFEAEVETLGKIRHKNIVRLWCCCKTKDCKLLVYEYMPNGSLGDLLHGPKGGLLDWPTRYKIALDSAEGLSYLHHDCVPAIVHRDIKSNNILLGGEFGAKVADFGVAKVVDAIGKGTRSMSVIAGSCGYIAPEYAYTLRVNEKSDTYSFGVVILELVTGKRPVDPEYGEKDLVKWVCTTMDQKGVDHVIDPKLNSCFKEDICKMLNIGLLCTSPLPINRPSMRRVVKMLQEVGGENMSKSGKKDGKLTPYYYEDASDQGSVA